MEELEQTPRVAQILQHKVVSMDGLKVVSMDGFMAITESEALHHTQQKEEEQDLRTENRGSSIPMGILRKTRSYSLGDLRLQRT